MSKNRNENKNNVTPSKAVNAIKEYLNGISKRDKKRIEQELEQEAVDEDPLKNAFTQVKFAQPTYTPGDWISYDPSKYNIVAPASWLDSISTDVMFLGDDGPQFIAEPSAVIPEEVQDVDFE